MRFLTTIYPSGRLEYFLVNVVLGIAWYALALFVADITVDVDSLAADPASFSLDDIAYSEPSIQLALTGFAVLFFVFLINTCRRLKDLRKSYFMVLFMFIPLISLFFTLFLFLAKDSGKKTYTPFGNDPYDPNSWVPPATNHAGPSVSYQGDDIYLPGEQAPGEQAA